ncbi:MAG TPA: glycosyltransferase family 4 protein [Vicinamibacterales bacterium]|nr:glycosyltransferase family 4 protein [Vicinamibacterales bacterium]
MNCLHILSSEYPPDVGGVADYTRQVAEALARAGEEIHVWTSAARETSEASGVRVHPDPGRFRPSDLRKLGARLDQFPSPRRILVQWVPHGYGYRSMNLWFCFWLAARARAGDRIELMVHEPFLAFRQGRLRHICVALVHRVMTIVLLAASRRVGVAIPAWEPMLRPFALGHRIRIDWLPIPGCVSEVAGQDLRVRQRYASQGQPLVGHFGSYGPDVTQLLEQRLPAIMNSATRPALLLIGASSEAFRTRLASRHPAWAARVHAAGYVPAASLASHLQACDLFVQPYPDGITSRRTSAMACLSMGRPVVTTSGHLTEALWGETGATVLVDVDDPNGFSLAACGLLTDVDARREVGARSRQVYLQSFSVDRVVNTLRAG